LKTLSSQAFKEIGLKSKRKRSRKELTCIVELKPLKKEINYNQKPNLKNSTIDESKV